MSEAKVAIKVGGFEFSGEGDPEWVSKQLDKIIEKVPGLINLAPTPMPQEGESDRQPMAPDTKIGSKSLPVFLREKGASKNQVKKFLATAVWLEAKGEGRISTSDVTKALRDASQSKLGNASKCLSDNIGKGYCEKVGKEFFVTEDGKNSL